MTADNVQGAQADRAGGSKYRYAAPGHKFQIPVDNQPSRVIIRANTGMAAVRLSMRSIMPPWPGSRALLSLMPRKRLSMLSSKSPTTATRADNTLASSSSKASTVPAPAIWLANTASTATPAGLPDTPAEDLQGLTSGASSALTNAVEAEGLPMSANLTAGGVDGIA